MRLDVWQTVRAQHLRVGDRLPIGVVTTVEHVEPLQRVLFEVGGRPYLRHVDSPVDRVVSARHVEPLRRC